MVYKPQSRAAAGRPNVPVCAVASSFCAAEQEPVQGRVLKAYFADLDEQSHIRKEGKKKTTTYTASFRRIAQAVPGRRIWLIVETTGLEGITLDINLRCARSDRLLDKDAAVTVIQNGAETGIVTATIGGWTGSGRYQHTEMYANWAIAELQIGPIGVADRKDWAKRLESCTDHQALVFVEIRARTGIPVEYANEDPARGGNTHDKSVFMNEEGKHLQLLTCCRADISVGQLKEVFPGAPADKIQGVADEFNRTYTVNGRQQKLFEIFHVDTCLRRAHFFAQAKVESKTVGGVELVGAFKGESFNYAIDDLLSGRVFKCFVNPQLPELVDAAIRLGRGPYEAVHPVTHKKCSVAATQRADESGIANITNMDKYRDRKHRLGNIYRGDGWKFRGRGLLQLTGRENYTNVQNWLDLHVAQNGIDLLNITEEFTALEAVLSSGYFWERLEIYKAADVGSSVVVVDSVTRMINPPMEAKLERQAAFRYTDTTFRRTECLRPANS